MARDGAPKTRIITVSDRESDINLYLGEAYAAGADVIVRAMAHRLDWFTEKTLGKSVGREEIIGNYTLPLVNKYKAMSNTFKRKGERLKKPLRREAEVEVRAKEVLISVEGGGEKKLPFTCVYVKENRKSKDAIEWLLLTTLSVDTIEDAMKVIEYYKARWFIEVYHKTLKSGCGIEESRLGHASKLQNYLLMMSLSALQICLLTYLQRSRPQETCEVVLSPTQWRALFLYFNQKSKIPVVPPTVGEVTVWIARLGGFLARKNDGYPGTLTMWKGWLRLQDIHEAFLRFSGKNYG